jgi:hypothetical protein
MCSPLYSAYFFHEDHALFRVINNERTDIHVIFVEIPKNVSTLGAANIQIHVKIEYTGCRIASYNTFSFAKRPVYSLSSCISL